MPLSLGPLDALTPRGRLVLPLGVLMVASGAWWSYPVLVGVGLVMVALVVAELVAVHRSAPVGVRREVARHVVVRNDACPGTLRLSGNRRSGLVRVDAADQVDERLIPVRLVDGNESGSTSISYDIPTTRRGLVTVGPVRVRRTGLTGMAARAEETGDVDHVRVLPRRIPLAGMAAGHRRAVNAVGNSLETGGTDLLGLHEYTAGDDLRRLHWPTSARTGTLMVREDADPSEPHVFVLLDDRSASHAEGDGFEDAVELADALCRAAIEAGSPVRFRTATGSHEVDVPATRPGEPSVAVQDLEWLLAEIQPVPEAALADLGTRDLDVFAAVSGAAAQLTELSLLAGEAITHVTLVVDPSPSLSVQGLAGTTVLRASTSDDLAAVWDRAVAR